MALIDHNNNKELATIEFRKSKMNALIPRTTLASIESLTMPLVQEIVLLADYRCAMCQKRVADIISRMNGETESVVVSLLEKKVTLTHRVVKAPSQKFGAICKRPLSKFAVITRLFCASLS
ncbi:hypothetical protein LguiA_000551 [Lonicera macranthoides]